MTVAIDWLWSYLTYQRGARLIHRSRHVIDHDVCRIETITDRNFL